jgi:hypothetical protein
LAIVEKALEPRGPERFVRDAQFHPLSARRQCCFTGRFAFGLDPIADAAR